MLGSTTQWETLAPLYDIIWDKIGFVEKLTFARHDEMSETMERTKALGAETLARVISLESSIGQLSNELAGLRQKNEDLEKIISRMTLRGGTVVRCCQG